MHKPETKKRGKSLAKSFFNRSVLEVAPDLIGATLLVDGVGGRIVEVEAYHHTEPAAHSYNGPTSRNSVMFGPAGHAYIYRSYGIHWCLNFVCEPAGSAAAVLIRALEPVEGLRLMRRRRGLADPRLLCSGPGRLLRCSPEPNRSRLWLDFGSASPKRWRSRGAMARRDRGFSASRFRKLEHEKWLAVFEKGSCSTKKPPKRPIKRRCESETSD